MKNENGQTLVLFILILPIIIIILSLLINYAILSSKKIELENNIKSALEYGLNLKINSEDETKALTNNEIKNKLEYLLKQNIEYDKLNITVNETNITINLTKKIDSFLNLIPSINNKLNISYYGEIIDKKIRVERR